MLSKNKKTVPVWLDMFLFSFFFFIAMAASEGVTISILHTDQDSLRHLFISTYLSALFSLLLVILMHCIIDRRPWKEIGINTSGPFLKYVTLGCFVPLAIFLIGFFVCVITGSITIDSIRFDNYSFFLSLLVYIPGAFIEEILMRGYLLNRLLRTRLNPWVSILIVSCIFSLLHLANPGIGIVAVINLIISGIVFGIIFLYTKNLLFPIISHFMWNWLQGSVFGFKVSGEDYFSSLITFSMNKPDLINGGDFGFEGSVLCCFLLIIEAVAMYVYLKKDNNICSAAV